MRSDLKPFAIELDGIEIQSDDDFFKALSRATQLDLTDNLNALDEDLEYEIPLCCGPFTIKWKNAEKSDWSGYTHLTAILGVLFYAQQRHPDRFVSLELEVNPEEDEDTWSYPAAFSSPLYKTEREKRRNGAPAG